MVGAGQLARMTHQAAVALGQSLRVLAADPTREDRWAAVEHQLAGRFKPGEFPIPMRVDILKPQR